MTNEELVKLFMDTGNEYYLEELIEKTKGIIYNVARSFAETTYIDIEDLIQEGIIELYKATFTYNADKSKFITYLTACLKRTYSGIYTYNMRQSRRPKSPLVNIDNLDYRNLNNTVIDDIGYREVEERDFINRLELTPTEQIIVDCILAGYKKNEIAKILNCSKPNISYYMKKFALKAKTNFQQL